MSNIVLTYHDNELDKDISVSSDTSISYDEKLNGSLNIKLSSELDKYIGIISFNINTSGLEYDKFKLSLMSPAFSSNGKVTSPQVGLDATFTEVVAEVIEDLYGVETSLSYSHRVKSEIEQEKEKVKNI